MYFALAIWYAFAAIGLLSMWLFVGLILKLFDGDWIEEAFGYPSYFIILASYAFLAVPLAATLDNGFEHDFLFLLGVLSLGVWALIHRLEVRHKTMRLGQHLAQARAMAAPASPPPIPTPQGPAFMAAPSSFANDFDVPPQGRPS